MGKKDFAKYVVFPLKGKCNGSFYLDVEEELKRNGTTHFIYFLLGVGLIMMSFKELQ